MLYVLLATHSAEACPTSNAKTREHMSKSAPQIPQIAQRLGIKIVAGPLTSQEHLSTLIVEADNGETLDKFLEESRLSHWNSVRVIPSTPLVDALQQIQKYPPIY
jgi:hypothetical protein